MKAKYDGMEAFLILWQLILTKKGEKPQRTPSCQDHPDISCFSVLSGAAVFHNEKATGASGPKIWTIDDLLLIKSQACASFAYESKEAVARWWEARPLEKETKHSTMSQV